MYYLLIYYDEYTNRKKVLFFNSDDFHLEVLENIYTDRILIPLDEEQARKYLQMEGPINF